MSAPVSQAAQPAQAQRVSIGRIVHYYLGDVYYAPKENKPREQVYRPAMVVAERDGVCSLSIYLDGTADRNVLVNGRQPVTQGETADCRAFRRGVVEGTTPGTWRWPPKV